MLSTLKHFHLTAGMRQIPDMWHNGVFFLFEVSKLLNVCTEVLCCSKLRAKMTNTQSKDEKQTANSLGSSCDYVAEIRFACRPSWQNAVRDFSGTRAYYSKSGEKMDFSLGPVSSSSCFSADRQSCSMKMSDHNDGLRALLFSTSSLICCYLDPSWLFHMACQGTYRVRLTGKHSLHLLWPSVDCLGSQSKEN